MQQDFTKGNPAKKLFFFTLPILLGNVFQQMYNLVDSSVVGHLLGKEALGAVGASFPVIFTVISLIIGVGGGFTIVVSQYFGAKEYGNVKRTISTMYIFIFVCSTVCSIISLVLSEDIFILLNLPPKLLNDATTYFNIYMAGLILFFGYAGTAAILRGLGDSKTPLYFIIFSTVLNIILDLLFVAVLHYDISGVAYATIISQGITFFSLAIYVHKKNTHLRLGRKDIVFDMDIFKKSLRIGLPGGVKMIAVSAGLVIISRIVNKFGTEVIAAYSAAMRIDALAMIPAMSFGQSLATFVGQNMGRHLFDRVHKCYNAGLLQSFIACLLMTLIIVLFGNSLMKIFTTDPEVIRIGKEYLVIVSSFYTFLVLLFTSNNALRGAGDTIIPMFITIVALWIIRIPLAYYFSEIWEEKGIWWSIPAGWGFGAIFSTIYFYSGHWKTKGIIKRPK